MKRKSNYYLQQLRHFPGLLTLTILSALLAILISVQIPELSGTAMAQLIQFGMDMAYYGEAEKGFFYQQLLQLVLFFAALWIISMIMNSFSTQLMMKLYNQLQIDVYRHLENFPVLYFDQTPLGQSLRYFNEDLNHVSAAFRQLANSYLQLLLIVGNLAVMAWLYPMALLVLLPTLLLVLLINGLLLRQAKKNAGTLRYKQQALHSYVEGASEKQAFIRFYGLEAYFQKGFHVHQREASKTEEKEHIYQLLPVQLTNLGWIVSMGSMILFGTYELFNQPVTLSMGMGNIILYVLFSKQIFDPLVQISSSLQVIMPGLQSLKRLTTLLATPLADEQAAAFKQTDNLQAIEARDVHFAYQKQHGILEKMSFTLCKGQLTALIGPSGSGKTSLMNVLSGFYAPDDGQLIVTLQDGQSLPLQESSIAIGFVMQENFFFAGSILDNLTLGNHDVSIDEVVYWLKKTALYTTCMQLPKALATAFNEADFGMRERQLLALVRALLQQPQLLLLDEVTSYADAQTEELILTILEEQKEQLITLIITHKPLAAARADQVLLIQNHQLQQVTN